MTTQQTTCLADLGSKEFLGTPGSPQLPRVGTLGAKKERALLAIVKSLFGLLDNLGPYAGRAWEAAVLD